MTDEIGQLRASFQQPETLALVLICAGVLREKREKSQIHNAELSQPLVTAIQVALVDLLESWNIAPAAVVGHSSGNAGKSDVTAPRD